MRRILLGLSIFLAGMGVAMAQSIPPVMQPDISDNASGSVWFDNDQSSVWFTIQEQTDWDTSKQRTSMEFGFEYSLSGGQWRSGRIYCEVPNTSVNSTQSRSSFSVRVNDFSGCQGGVSQYIGGEYSEIPWTYPVEFSGYMTQPGVLTLATEARSVANTFSGVTTRWQCQSGTGENAGGGGFSVLLPGTEEFRYFQFGSSYETPGLAHGYYNYTSCRSVVKNK